MNKIILFKVPQMNICVGGKNVLCVFCVCASAVCHPPGENEMKAPCFLAMFRVRTLPLWQGLCPYTLARAYLLWILLGCHRKRQLFPLSLYLSLLHAANLRVTTPSFDVRWREEGGSVLGGWRVVVVWAGCTYASKYVCVFCVFCL